MSAEAKTDQEFEAEWWGACANTFGEEAKQITYAHRMGLVNEPRFGKWPVFDLRGASVVDLGGGPSSLLLKCVNGWGIVVDPCPYPDWVADRYSASCCFGSADYEGAEIFYRREKAETFSWPTKLSEAWCYNVLQHVEDPEAVIAAARKSAHALRIFEWIETEPTLGHPHMLHADDLNTWIGSTGSIGHVDENGATGLAYWGAFQL